MKLTKKATGENKVNKLEHLLQLKTKELEQYKLEKNIDLALERVREKAMAMRNSKDISEATAIVFNELKRLGINMIRAGIIIFNKTHIAEVWSTSLSPKDKQVIDIVTGNLNMDIHPMLKNSYLNWKNKNDYFTYELTGKEVLEYYKLLAKEPDYKFPKRTNTRHNKFLTPLILMMEEFLLIQKRN